MSVEEKSPKAGIIEAWSLERLRVHPENVTIFGNPEESDEYEVVRESIKKHGMWEPIVARADGTILSGHVRRACAEELGLKEVPVRVMTAFPSYVDEVKFVIRSNTDRRQLNPQQIALAFKRLKELPREQGGAKATRGRPKADEEKGGASSTFSKTRDDAAKMLGVGEFEARALEAVFTTEGVPAALKTAVNEGRVTPTTAAKAIRAELKRQDGTITSGAALEAVAATCAAEPSKALSHEERVDQEAARYQEDFAKLVKLYRELNDVLTRRPLKAVLGWSDHAEYAGLIRDTAMRAIRELESVEGTSATGKQLALTVIKGGKE